jgi:hypothetical protein
VFEGYQCCSCIYVLWVSMLVMYLCVRGIDVGHAFVCEGYRCCVMYLCVRGIDVGRVFVCEGYRCW